MDAFSLYLLCFFSLSYLLGSIPFGFILTKIFTKQDIRKTGSGNIGATNVLRSGNKLLAIITLIMDSSKGAVAVVLALIVYSINNLYVSNAVPELPRTSPFEVETLASIMGLFAIIGHCFPIWLKFKGGKGVATALGVFLIAVPYAGLAACAAWILTAKITRISSLSALVAVGIAPIVTLFIYGSAPAGICALITLLVWIRHKDNIKRLLKGEEPKIGADNKNKEEAKVESVSE